MRKSYYIFTGNKVLYRVNESNGVALNQREWEALGTALVPDTIVESPTEKGTYSVELPTESELPSPYRWVSLRSLVGKISDEFFNRCGRASQLLHWEKTTTYCGSCGNLNKQHPREPAKICSLCNTSSYPTIAPCIIVLICKEEQILLARSPRFPEKVFSTLAGFIEPGESAEETVVREIFEEVRLRVTNITYFDSQPWPFPGQLMLGFFADYLSGDIVVDGKEICEAHWYSHENLPQIPGSGTIAGRLIRHHISTMRQGSFSSGM